MGSQPLSYTGGRIGLATVFGGSRAEEFSKRVAWIGRAHEHDESPTSEMLDSNIEFWGDGKETVVDASKGKKWKRGMKVGADQPKLAFGTALRRRLSMEDVFSTVISQTR